MDRAAFIQAWLVALRSGKYSQAKQRLKRTTKKADGKKEVSYCCLGVACVVANETGAAKVSQRYIDSEFGLPQQAQKLLGINSTGDFNEPIFYAGEQYESLAYLNDQGVSFKRLARIIERELKRNNFVNYK